MSDHLSSFNLGLILLLILRAVIEIASGTRLPRLSPGVCLSRLGCACFKSLHLGRVKALTLRLDAPLA